jgi:hypothetical protein
VDEFTGKPEVIRGQKSHCGKSDGLIVGKQDIESEEPAI